MNADRQAKLRSLFVNRMKIGMVKGLVAFDAAEEYSTAPRSLARVISLSDSGIERSGSHSDEFEAALGLSASFAKP
jgi:hypothetical protein